MVRIRIFAAAAALAGVLAAAGPAQADFEVHLPLVVPGETAVEHRGSYGFDPAPEKNDEQSYTVEIERSVTDFWATAIEGEFGREPGPDNHARFTALTSENTFVLTEPGKYWADFGFFAEYSRVSSHNSPDELNFGPIVSKVIGPTVNTLNLFLEKDVGTHAAGRPAVSLAWQTRFTLNPLLDPGIEVFSNPGAFLHLPALQSQDHRAGPVLYGSVRSFGPGGRIKYEFGYLFGLTRAAPQGTIKWTLEYELFF